MASVFLHKEDLHDLPAVCAECAAPATLWRSKQFVWHPPWVFVLILAGPVVYGIAAVLSLRRCKARVPLCGAHKRHWSRRYKVIFGGLAGLGLFGLAPLFLLGSAPAGPPSGWYVIFALLSLGLVVGLGVCWLGVVVSLLSTAIRAEEIQEDGITLTNVSAGFAQACVDRWLGLPNFDPFTRDHRTERQPGDSARRIRQAPGYRE